MKKLLLKERFQQLAGIKPLYEIGNLNLITEQSASGNDPDCFACINNTVVTLPSSSMAFPSYSYTTCGRDSGYQPYFVDLAALNNELNAIGSGSCGSGGGNPPPTGSCNVSQAATSQIAGGNPQLGDFGINQNFVNNMAGKSDNFYQNRMQAFRSKRESLEISGQSYCQGENPNWQAKLFNKEKYAQRCLIKYNDPNQTNC